MCTKGRFINKNIPAPLDWKSLADMRINDQKNKIQNTYRKRWPWRRRREIKVPNSLSSQTMTFVCVDGLLTCRTIQAS